MITDEQKYIGRSMALGVITAILALSLSWYFAPLITINPHNNTPPRMDAFAIGMILAILPMLVMIGILAKMRFFSSGIDGSSTPAIDINLKILNNTHEQTLLFTIAALGLSVSIPSSHLSMIPILAIVFICARIIFWYGYHHNAIKRAYGFASTFYTSVLILIFAIIRLIFF